MCFLFTQKTAYEMRMSDWSSAVCSSDLLVPAGKVVASDRTIGLILHPRTPDDEISPPLRRFVQTFVEKSLTQHDRRAVRGRLEKSFQVATIGRASCRERLCQYVSLTGVGVKLKKTPTHKQRKLIS